MDQSVKIENISDVEVIPLKIIRDHRGAVMHMMKSSSDSKLEIGEIYFSVVNKDVVKGWKRHKIIKQNMVVPEGLIRLIIYDDRDQSKTKGSIQIIDFGLENYVLVKLPPMVWYSFKSIAEGHSIIANCISDPHNPDESETLSLETDKIPYVWKSEVE